MRPIDCMKRSFVTGIILGEVPSSTYLPRDYTFQKHEKMLTEELRDMYKYRHTEAEDLSNKDLRMYIRFMIQQIRVVRALQVLDTSAAYKDTRELEYLLAVSRRIAEKRAW